MIRSLVLVALFAASALALPQQQAAPAGQTEPPVQILSQSDVVGTDGSFNYSYALSNGINVEESGFVKKNEALAARSGAAAAEGEEDNSDIQVVTGSFSYTAPDGTKITLRYKADENGFQPEGDHLPVAPPVPEAIQRALNAIAASPAPEEPQPSLPPQ